MLTTDLAYIGPVVGVKRVYIAPDKINRRVPLTDRMGINNILLNYEQEVYLRALGGANFNNLVLNRYIETASNGRLRLFMFAFEFNTVVITQQKGEYSRLLSIGVDNTSTEAYRLQTLTLNPCSLRHCFMSDKNVTIPLFQPPNLTNGEQNFWSIKTINLV